MAIEVTAVAVPETEEADPETKEARQAAKEAANKGPSGTRTGVPDTRTTRHLVPAGSIGSMARELGFVLIDTTAHGETTRVQGRGTTETSLQELKL